MVLHNQIQSVEQKGEARQLVDAVPYFNFLLSVEAARRQGYYEPKYQSDGLTDY